MKILNLKLKNFRGHRSFEVTPNGESLDIYGANYSGKSTIADAITYLMTGKDSQDRSPAKFGIKTRKELEDGTLGDELHGLEHIVEATYALEIGKELTLKKVYVEQWTTHKGSSQEELTGHTTKYYWDDEPVSATEYNNRLDAIISQERYKMLSLPDYFPSQMHWTGRREILSEMAGDITREDVIARDPDLYRYIEMLDGKTQEAMEKILSEKKKKLNEELGTRTRPGNITARISEAQGFISDPDQSKEEAEEELSSLKNKKDKIEAKRSEVKSGGTIADLNVKKQTLESEKSKAENEHNKANANNISDTRSKVSDLQDKLDSIEGEFREAQRNYHSAESEVEKLQSKKSIAKDKLQTAKESKPKEDTGPDVCPMCERPLEEDEHSYKDYVQEFNAEKAKNIKALKKEVETYSSELEQAQSAMEKAGKKAVNIKGKMNQRKQALEGAQKVLQGKKDSQPAFHASEEYERITSDIDEIDEKIVNHKQEKQAQLDKLEEAITAIQSKIEDTQTVISQYRDNKKYNERITELQKQRKAYGKQLDEVEADLHLIEIFQREKGRLIEQSVNDKFDYVQWQLFDYLISGGTKEVCNAVYKSRPYDVLSTSEKAFVGIDIINTLSEHFEMSVPCFVDNRESITEIPENDLQVISLLVSEDDKQLRIEREQQKVMEVA